MNATEWIERLQLGKHPEGGYYRETYRSGEILHADGLPTRYGGARSVSTTIYYLLEGDDFSAMHRLRSDEIWHFYAGDALELHEITPDGHGRTTRLGPEDGFQAVMAAGTWFGVNVASGGAFALAGCTVAPGFDFRDFEFADRAGLATMFPKHRATIERLTRE